MLVLMMIIYTAATALAGFSQDIYTLLAIRTIQGIAIANTPIGLKIIRDQFPKSKFSIGQSIVTSAYSAGMALGVVLTNFSSNYWLANYILHLRSNCSHTFILYLAKSPS
jgi:MFS family permease